MSLGFKSFWTLQRCDRRTEASRMGYGYTAALVNFAFLEHAVWTTDEPVKAMESGSPKARTNPWSLLRRWANA
jgi:hypothetical protein